MTFFGKRQRRGSAPDPRWAIAAATPCWPCAQPALDELARAHRPVDEPVPPARAGGAVVAQRHPTGWFVHGLHTPRLSAEELGHFTHFVTVRVFLLLMHGPQPSVWRPCPSGSGQEWRAVSELWQPDRLDLPETVPAGW